MQQQQQQTHIAKAQFWENNFLISGDPLHLQFAKQHAKEGNYDLNLTKEIILDKIKNYNINKANYWKKRYLNSGDQQHLFFAIDYVKEALTNYKFISKSFP